MVNRDDDGSASIEFIFVGLILLVPLVYLVIALGAIQHHSLGAEAGARHIARAISTAENAEQARERGDAIFRAIVDEYGMDSRSVDVDIQCSEPATSCPTAGAIVTVRVTTSVRLPLVPAVLGLEDLAKIPVEAQSVQKVSRFWRDE